MRQGRAWAWGLVLGIVACGDVERTSRPVSRLDGVVHFLGPVAGAPVVLYALNDGGPPTLVEQTNTDTAGTYAFPEVRAGAFLVVADASGLPFEDPATGAVGAYAPGTQLKAEVPDLATLESRVVQVTPLTTLAAGVTAGLRTGGVEAPAREAGAAFHEWLTLDPVTTPIGEPRSGASDARRHRLLLDAWSTLAAFAADEAGVGPGTSLTADRVLAALVEDLGPPPPRFDGRGDAGPVSIAVGPGRYELNPQTLRGRYAEAVQARLAAPAWATTTPADVADLVASLRCAPVPIFETCADDGRADRTPPAIADPTPAAGAALAGVVTIEVSARDPDSGVRSLSLARVLTEGLEPLPLADEDDRPGVVRIVLDTREFLGHASITLLARAENREGASSARRLDYALANVPPGQLAGFVVKGPAVAVEVAAFALRADRSEVELARALTENEGGFTMTLHGWRGPVVVRATGAADGARTSAFYDEARGRLLSWDADQSLTALVPEFDSTRPAQPIAVTPLTDLAWARAQGLAAQRGANLATAYRESLSLLGRHFELDEADTLLHLRPAAPDEPVIPPPNLAARYHIALGCFSQQALEIGRELSTEAPDGFTALDLLGAYRQDVLLDPLFDGRRGEEPILVGFGGSARPLGEGLRGELARACARWLVHPEFGPGLPIDLVVDQLKQIASDDSSLFAGSHGATTLDDDAPSVAVVVSATSAGLVQVGDRRRPEDATMVAGAVEIEFVVTDDSGVASFDVTTLAGTTHGLTEVEAPDASDGITEGTWRVRFDSTSGPDGPTNLRVTARDLFGQRSETWVSLDVRNALPSIRLAAAPGVNVRNGRWYTRADRLDVPIVTDTVGALIEPTVEMAGRRFEVEDGVAVLDLPRDEGLHELKVSARDDLGRVFSIRQPIAVDRTPPLLHPIEGVYRDEMVLDADRHLEEAPLLRATLGHTIVVRKWQDRWRRDDDNPIRLGFTTADAPSAGAGTLGDALAPSWRGLVNGAVVAEGDCDRIDDAGWRIDLAASTLSIDVSDPPAFRELDAEIEAQVTDLAGNRAILRSAVEIDLSPPPLAVALVEVTVEGRVGQESTVRLTDGSLADWLAGSTSEVRRLELRNPHSSPAVAVLEHPAEQHTAFGIRAGVMGRTEHMMESARQNHLGQQIPVPDHIRVFDVNIVFYAGDGNFDTCGLGVADLRDVDVFGELDPWADMQYSTSRCIERVPAPDSTAIVASELSLRVANHPSPTTIALAPGESVLVSAVSTVHDVPDEVRALVPNPFTTLPGYPHAPYLRDLQGRLVMTRPVEGVFEDRMCTTCFDDEPDCEPACQGDGPWVGYRVQALTDVRIRTAERGQAPQPWRVRTLSTNGNLVHETATLPPVPDVRLRIDPEYWGRPH